MGNLTKEEKLEILSKAIDEGYNIEIRSHNRSFENGIKFLDDNSIPLEKTEINGSHEKQYAWLISEDIEFSIIMFFHKVDAVTSHQKEAGKCIN